MSAAPELDPVHAALASGGHVCLVVDDEAAYDELAAGFLRHDRAAREKHVVVGPFGSGARRPASTAGHVIDPYDDLLGRGALQPGRLIARLRDDAAAAAADGYRRLRVVADLDWLLPTSPTLEEIVALEVLLGRAVADLDATVLCAYRRRSFGPDVLRAVASLHTAFAGGVPPSFTLVAGDDAGWVPPARSTSSAPRAGRGAAGDGRRPLGGRRRGPAVRRRRGHAGDRDGGHGGGLRPRAARRAPRLRRLWEVAGFDRSAPGVRFRDLPRG